MIKEKRGTSMIKLTDFIITPDMKRTKIKFNMNASDITKRAWDFLLEDHPGWLELNAWKTKQPDNNLNHADYLIALAQYYPYGPEYFVFGGLYKVEKIVPEVFDAPGYKLTLMDEYQEYIKRLIIKLESPIGRDVYNRLYRNVQAQLNPEVYEIVPNVNLGQFPGYQNICMTHKELKQIVERKEPSWQEALSYVKGVYVITDMHNGQLYVGSALGNTDGIWQRWSEYAHPNNLTGGNKAFLEILKEKGSKYIINNFQYSIIEIFDTKTKVETILARENYWKKVFKAKEFGMNHN